MIGWKLRGAVRDRYATAILAHSNITAAVLACLDSVRKALSSSARLELKKKNRLRLFGITQFLSLFCFFFCYYYNYYCHYSFDLINLYLSIYLSVCFVTSFVQKKKKRNPINFRFISINIDFLIAHYNSSNVPYYNRVTVNPSVRSISQIVSILYNIEPDIYT